MTLDQAWHLGGTLKQPYVMAGRLAAMIVCVALAPLGAAGSSIVDDTFVIDLPDGWITNLKANPVEVRGPGGEILLLSSAKYAGAGSPDEARSAMKNLDRIAQKAIRAVEKDPQFRTRQPLKTAKTRHGDTVYSMISTRKDGFTFAQFASVGARAVVLVTLEASNLNDSSIEVVRHAVEEIKWRKP